MNTVYHKGTFLVTEDHFFSVENIFLFGSACFACQYEIAFLCGYCKPCLCIQFENVQHLWIHEIIAQCIELRQTDQQGNISLDFHFVIIPYIHSNKLNFPPTEAKKSGYSYRKYHWILPNCPPIDWFLIWCRLQWFSEHNIDEEREKKTQPLHIKSIRSMYNVWNVST